MPKHLYNLLMWGKAFGLIILVVGAVIGVACLLSWLLFRHPFLMFGMAFVSGGGWLAYAVADYNKWFRK